MSFCKSRLIIDGMMMSEGTENSIECLEKRKKSSVLWQRNEHDDEKRNLASSSGTGNTTAKKTGDNL